jgi:AcrR family transcriptional regulator
MTGSASQGFRVTSERHRLLAAAARTLARDGYHATTTRTIACGAGVTSPRLEAEFGDLHGCLIAATLVAVHQAYFVVLQAYQREDLWPDGVREALRALLDFLAAEPDFVRTCLVELRYVPDSDRHIAAAREAFTAFLTPGHDADAEIPLLTAEFISGGVLHLITRYSLEDRVAELPAALAEMTNLVLSPYLPPTEIERAIMRC